MKILHIILLICFLFIYFSASASQDGVFETVDLTRLSEANKKYLGLDADVKPVLANVEADLIVFEFMNVYCKNCKVQALIFNKLYRSIENDPILRSRAKIMSIAAGNNESEVKQFRDDLGAIFPILIDPEFAVYERLAGSINAPYTVMLRKNEEGDLIVAASHRGAIGSHKSYLEEMKVVLQYDESILELRREERAIDGEMDRTELKLSEEELIAKIRGRMIVISGDENILVALKPVPLRGNPRICEKVYEGKSGAKKYFAAVINREPVCDVCHAAQFIYTFDEKGKVVDFEPIYLTKGHNDVWDKEDVEKTRKSLVGKSVFQPADFNSEVDAVTSATITSAVIFHAISQGRNILRLVR